MKLSIVSASVLLAAMSVSAYAYTPGTYTAAIAGQNGPVKVEVTTSARTDAPEIEQRTTI